MKISFFDRKQKEELSSAKREKLLKDIGKLDKNLFNIASGLIDEISFMYAELTDLKEIIKKSGAVEVYQNGANQFGLKKSAATDAYNTTLKNYVVVNKQLAALISGKAAEEDDEFDNFLNEK